MQPPKTPKDGHAGRLPKRSDFAVDLGFPDDPLENTRRIKVDSKQENWDAPHSKLFGLDRDFRGARHGVVEHHGAAVLPAYIG
jgi:hypothetical protein